jgi:hypothetical protein
MVCNPEEKLVGFDNEECEDFIKLEENDCLDCVWNEMSYRFFSNDYYDDLADEEGLFDLET